MERWKRALAEPLKSNKDDNLKNIISGGVYVLVASDEKLELPYNVDRIHRGSIWLKRIKSLAMRKRLASQFRYSNISQ
jgi:hypothetical protein